MAPIHRHPRGDEDPDGLPVERGLPLPLRILALTGALSFLLLGINSLLPLLRSPPPPASPLDPSRQAVS